jgi:hypothetical protein
MICSARSRIVVGTSMPGAFAVFMLIVKQNRLGCSTGRSAGRERLRRLRQPCVIALRASADDLHRLPRA